mmetsp:Transcript_98289/g.254163  ORF Transcript_98289/g.254163 Transcript_98289/m.254163 type:complete len:353 (-) Transcript_98289:2-1060(-)
MLHKSLTESLAVHGKVQPLLKPLAEARHLRMAVQVVVGQYHELRRVEVLQPDPELSRVHGGPHVVVYHSRAGGVKIPRCGSVQRDRERRRFALSTAHRETPLTREVPVRLHPRQGLPQHDDKCEVPAHIAIFTGNVPRHIHVTERVRGRGRIVRPGCVCFECQAPCGPRVVKAHGPCAGDHALQHRPLWAWHGVEVGRREVPQHLLNTRRRATGHLPKPRLHPLQTMHLVEASIEEGTLLPQLAPRARVGHVGVHEVVEGCSRPGLHGSRDIQPWHDLALNAEALPTDASNCLCQRLRRFRRRIMPCQGMGAHCKSRHHTGLETHGGSRVYTVWYRRVYRVSAAVPSMDFSA